MARRPVKPRPARAPLRAVLLALAFLALVEVFAWTFLPIPPRDRPLPFRSMVVENCVKDLGNGVGQVDGRGQLVDLPRPPGRIRWVAVGGSSAAGSVLSLYQSFPWLLQRRLRARGLDAEVLNLAIPGTDSAIHEAIIAGALRQLQPHGVIVLSGNNEFHRLRAYRSLRPSWTADVERVRRLLEGLALYRLLAGRLERPVPAGGLDNVSLVDITVGVTDSDVLLIRDCYARNLEGLLGRCRRARVPVVLCTVPVNETTSPDYHRPPPPPVRQVFDRAKALAEARPEEAERVLRQGLRRHPESAHLYYELGMLARARGDTGTARWALHWARELDATPNRALPSMNYLVRRLGDRPGVLLLEAEDLLRRESPDGILDDTLFFDNCHMRAPAHGVVARGLEELLAARGLVPPGPAGRVPPSSDPWDFESPDGVSPEGLPPALARAWEAWWSDRYEEAAACLQEALGQNPGRPVLLRNLGDALLAARQHEAALEAYEAFLAAGGVDPRVREDVARLRRAGVRP